VVCGHCYPAMQDALAAWAGLPDAKRREALADARCWKEREREDYKIRQMPLDRLHGMFGTATLANDEKARLAAVRARRERGDA